MTKAEKQLQARAERLRVKLAEAEAVAAHLRNQLSRIDRKITGEPDKQTGLDLLWKAAPPMARTRSSQVKCRKAWNMIPESERPKITVILSAIHAWSRCWDWKKDGGMFVPGLDKWIRDRRWENLPEDTAGSGTRGFAPSKPVPTPTLPQTQADQPATPADIAEAFAPLKRLFPSTRVNS